MKFYCCRCIADKQGWNGPNLLNLEYLLRFARCMSGKISRHHQQHTDTNASWQKKCRWRTILRAMSTPNYIHPVLSLRAHFGPFTASVFWRPIRVCLLDLSILLYKRKVCNLWIFYCYFFGCRIHCSEENVLRILMFPKYLYTKQLHCTPDIILSEIMLSSVEVKIMRALWKSEFEAPVLNLC